MFLIDCCRKCGMISRTGFGAAPLSWTEIKAWSELSGIILEHEEYEAVHLISASYASMLARAKDWDCCATRRTKPRKRKKSAGIDMPPLMQ